MVEGGTDMKNFGLFLIVVGFVIGTMSAVLDPKQVSWTMFAVGALAGVVGVALARIGTHLAATSKETLAANIKDIDSSLASIIEQVRSLRETKADVDVYDLPQHIEDNLHEHISCFVTARESMIHVYDLNVYADVMSLFAAGERYVNRVWSASAEGYVDEAHTYIDKSCTQFEAAADLIAKAKGQPGANAPEHDDDGANAPEHDDDGANAPEHDDDGA